MAISKAGIQLRLYPYFQRKLAKETLELLTDEVFLSIFNEVAKDLNERAELRIERFYKKTVAANATDANLTNYVTQKPILKVMRFRYEDDGYADQIWTYIHKDANGDGRIVLKTTVTSSIQLDVYYLADLDDISDSTDEIDLPDNVLPEYLELCRKKILLEYGDGEDVDYEQWLNIYADKARMKQDSKFMKGQPLPKYWLGRTGDTAIRYNILENYVTDVDNVAANIDGDYVFYT